MSEPTPEDREAARKWGQQKKPGCASAAIEWAHEQLDGRLQPEIQDVTRNYAAAFAGEVRADGYAHGLVQGRADEKTAQAKCWTCGGDPDSHPSGALCICENGTHASEVVHLRMLAQQGDGERCAACRHYWWRKGACTKALGENDEDRRYWSEPSHRPRWCPGFERDPHGCHRCGRGSNEPIPPDTKCERCRCLNDQDELRNIGDEND